MIRRLLRYAIALALAAYLAAAGYMAFNQRSFLYRPASAWQAPSDFGLAQASRIELKADDGTSLLGWWLPPKHAEAPVYLYFHGNANGLERRAGRFGLMSADGAGVLAMSYRGYGGSGGAPSEALLHADALRIYRHLRETFGPERIVIFGESLGTGVALNLIRQVDAKAVILDSPYYSVLSRGQASYPWLPVSLLLTDTFRSDLWIAQARAPVFILHGTADRLIPAADSEKLAAQGKPGNVQRKLYAGEPHVVPYGRGPSVDVLDFLGRLPKR